MTRKMLLITTAVVGGLLVGGLAEAQVLGPVTGTVGGTVGLPPGGVTGDVGGTIGAPVPRASPGPITAPKAVVRTPGLKVPDAQVDINAPVNLSAARRRALVAAGVAPIRTSEVGVYMDRQYQELETGLAGTGVHMRREGQSIILDMPGDVTFAFNKTDIRPRFIPVLDSVAKILNAYPATYMDITGHTDSIGSDAYNQTLSERRADKVAGYLVTRRALAARMAVSGEGEQDPIASNSTVEGRAANRRVEIVLHPYAG